MEKESKNIRLDRIELLNFKGIAEKAIDFCKQGTTSIYGANRTGKTTVCDAFSWLLFGKSSDGRSTQNFGIKTRDERGNTLPEIEHSVTAWITIGQGERTDTIKLQRTLKEVWVTKRGTTERNYTGDTEEYYWDDLRVKATEWKERIAAICDESIFQFVTNPLRFTGMPQKEQREQLIRMAGEVSVQDITDPAMQETIKVIANEPITDYITKMRNKASLLKKEIELDTARLEENRTQIFTHEQPEQIHRERMQQLKDDIDRHEQAISNSTELLNQRSERLQTLYIQRTRLQREQKEMEQELIEQAMERHKDQTQHKADLKASITTTLGDINTCKEKLKETDRKIAEQTERLESLRTAYDTKAVEKFQLRENDLVCPTCHRPLDGENREQRIEQMREEWNINHTNELDKLDDDGMQASKDLDNLAKKKTETETKMEELNIKVGRLTHEHDTMTIPGIYTDFKSDKEWTKITTDLDNTTRQIEEINEAMANDTRDDEMQTARDAANAELRQLKESLEETTKIVTNYENNAKVQKRMEELTAKIAAARGDIAECQKNEDAADALQKAIMTEVETRVNRLFTFVRFTLFEPQKNGGINEKCQANVNGIPYADVNNADKINAGLDIIETLCHYYGIFAPIFVDNAESVNALYETTAQQIRLVVTEDATLRIENC